MYYTYKIILVILFNVFIVNTLSFNVFAKNNYNEYLFVTSIRSDFNIETSQYASSFIAQHNNSVFLITAAHVARIMNNKTILRIGDIDNEYIDIKLIDITKDNQVIWQYHKYADIAIIELNSKNKQVDINAICISSNNFVKNHQFNINEDFLCVGYPLNHPLAIIGNDCFHPYVYKTYTLNKVIKMSLKDINNNINNVIPTSHCSFIGTSGSPLIKKLNNLNKFQIYGICHGSLYQTNNHNNVMSLFIPIDYFFDFF